MITRRLDRDRSTAFFTLAALVKAGFPLPDALAESIRSTGDKRLKNALRQINQDVLAGRSFYEALHAESDVFPPFIPALIRSGERAGHLAESLERIALILESNEDTRSELAAAMLYPAVILIASLTAVLFLSFTVTPGLADIYTSAGRDLPGITKLINHAGWVVIPILMVIIGAAGMGFSGVSIPVIRSVRTRIYKSIPLLNDLRIAHETSLWTGILSQLLSAGLPLPESLDIAVETLPESDTADALKQARALIEEGVPPGDAFLRSPHLPDLARRLIAAGDRSGDLAGSLEKAAGLYRSRYRKNIRILTALAEPVAVVLAGLIVMIIALSIMLPIAELGGLL